MGLFKRKQKPEERADPQRMVTAEESLLQALIGTTEVTKEMMLQIPTVRGCIDKLAGTACRLPICLYKKENGTVTEVTDDPRLRLLNRETGDTLNSDEFWRAMIEDYFLGKGGYAYIHKVDGAFAGLFYVKEEDISIILLPDPIFKDYDIVVNGVRYPPHAFLKIRRRARDGASSTPLWKENPLIFGIAHSTMVFEETMVKKGGNKRGFIEAEERLTNEAITAIKAAWRNLYSNNTENVVVLNKGAKFKESSNTSVEMQLHENKESNAGEICRMFGFPLSILAGGATESDRKEYLNAVMALLTTIEAALDRDLLLEREKGSFYFAFDTKEITRGSQEERYKAYGIALDHNFLQPDEVRAMEDLPPLGFNWVKIGLSDVLLDTKTGEIYTPNTNALTDLNKRKQKKGGEEVAD